MTDIVKHEAREELRKAERKPNAIGDQWRLEIVPMSEIAEVPQIEAVSVTRRTRREVDLVFHGASPGYVITQERDDIGDWLDTLRHISRKAWFTPAHATAFASVMAREMRLA